MTCHVLPSAAAQWVGDPVDTLTGKVVDQKLDFRLIGPFELWWQRHYDSSQSGRLFALGRGQTHSFDRRLLIEGDCLVYEAPLGQALRFPLPARVGQQCTLNGCVLRRLSIANFELRAHGEPTMEFEFRPGLAFGLLKQLIRLPHRIQFHYGAAGLLEGMTDSQGRRIAVASEADGRLLSLTLLHGHEQQSQLLVAYGYDERGNLVSTRNAAGHGYSFEYDIANRLVCRTGRKGFQFRFVYDAQGRCTLSMGDDRLYGVALDYGVAGRLTRVTKPDHGVWRYLFDAAGRLSRIADPMGGVQQFVRDETGRVALELDPNMNATRMSYDASGALLAKIDPLGHRFAMPADLNADEPSTERLADCPLEFEYGRLLDKDQIALPGVDRLQQLPWPEWILAQLIACPDAANNAGQRPSARVRPLGLLWWPAPKQGRVFTDLGKLVQQHDEFGRTRHWHYDASGNVAEFIDFDGRHWHYDTGRWHLQLSLTNPLGAEARFSYNTAGLVSSCTDAGGTLTEYHYDQNDHLVEISRHGAVRDRYLRDAFGNLLSKQAADGRELLRYDIGPANLMARCALASGDVLSFQHDASGRPVAVSTSKDSVQFAYDAWGNRVADQRNGMGVEHRFHEWRRPAETLVFGRFAVRFEWEAARTLVITDPGGMRHSVMMHANGLLERHLGGQVHEVAQFDSRGRCLVKYTHRALRPAWIRRYHWSGEGELQRVQDNLFGDVQHEYDAAHRLLRRSVGDRIEHYRFDAADNLISQPGLHDLVPRAGNRIARVEGRAFGYDDRNHLALRETSAGAVRYGHDSRDQLVEVRTPQGNWTADYDALGRRTRKTWAGQTTEFHWNGDQLIAETAPDGRLRLYVYADPMAMTPLLMLDYESAEAAPDACQRYFIFTDQLGTPRLIDDDAGLEAWRADVAPFGKALLPPDASIQFNLRFAGHYADDELSLHYNRFRYFDPGLGRYLQSDPWGLGGGLNVYAYRTNPLHTVDVRGLGEEGHDKDCKKKPDEELPPGMTKKEFDDLKAEMKAKGDAAFAAMKEANERGDRTVTLPDGTVLKTSDSGMGPCLSLAKDLKTGEVFYGQNTGKQPEGMAQPLQQRADAVAAANQAKSPAPEGYPPGWTRDKGIPGSHSEVQAVNQGMQARPDAKPEDFAIHNVRTQDNKNGNAGDPMPRCDNCKPITDGVIPLTD